MYFFSMSEVMREYYKEIHILNYNFFRNIFAF